MRQRTRSVLAASVVALGVLAWAAARPEGIADPMQNTARAAGTGRLDEGISLFARRAQEDPFSAGDRSMLAGLYLKRARESGSYEDVLRAEEAARRSLELREWHNADTYGLLAITLLEQHRFVEAREAAERLVAAEPEQLGGRALLAEIHLELGEYERAAAIFLSLELAWTTPDVAPRLARWLELTGRADEARARLYAARESALRAGSAGERAAWYHLRVGDFELRHGRLEEAESALVEGLAAFPGDYRILAAMARLSAARGRWDESLRYGEAVLGQLLDPGVLVVMSEVALAAGDSARAEELARVLQVATAGQTTAYHRDWDLFLLDRGGDAAMVARRAEEEIRARRDIYGYDVLAWAYYRLGRHTEAARAMRSALRTGASDPLLLYHAGMIEHALGRDEAAARLLAGALEISAGFHPTHAPAARATLESIRGPWYRRLWSATVSAGRDDV